MSIHVDGLVVSVAAVDVESAPGARPVVLLHGAGMDHTTWRYQTRRLAHAGYRPLAIDLPGHGGSEGDPLPTIEAMGDWLLRFFDVAGLEQAVVVGLSMGSLVAIETAAADPGRVTGIALLGAADSMPVNTDLMQAAESGSLRAVELLVGWSDRRAGGFSAASPPDPWTHGAVARILERGLHRSLANDLLACSRFDVTRAAALVGVPVLVVAGTEDRLTHQSGTKRLAGALGDCMLVTVTGGHFAALEEATLIQQVLVDWLDRRFGHAPGS
jgi:pimeloyl-ACP methyl ester carboxylesterase